ncbi:MAG: ABC transporter permease [Actinobacteria bacterium]|nr:ABC transporter permease [Actinomycetota bacterium]
MSEARHSWRRIKAIAWRHAVILRRTPHRLFDITIWPLVDVFLFGSIGVFAASQSGAGAVALGYLLSGIVLWHVVYQAQIALSTGVLEETWSRNLLNLMVTPLREIEYVAGVVLFGMAKLVAGVALVALTAVAFYSFDVTDLGVGLIPIAAILLVVGWIIALFVIAMVLRFGSGAEALAWGILFVVMPLSGVFYPIDALPALLRPVSAVLPTTYAFAAARQLIDGGTLPWDRIALAAATSVVMGAIVVTFLVRMLKLFRQRGYISRYS